MFGLLIQGVVLGLTLSVLMGPAFFTLIQTSIHRGFKPAFFLAIGVFLSDLTLIAVITLGMLGVLGALVSLENLLNPVNKIYFGIIGGIILIIFGVFTFTRKLEHFSREENNNGVNNHPGLMTFVLKGYFLNIANPILIIFWMGVVSGVISGGITGTRELFKHMTIFFSGALFTILSTDILKCFIADKIKSYLNPRVLMLINHIIGLILVVFGIALIVRVLILKTV